MGNPRVTRGTKQAGSTDRADMLDVRAAAPLFPGCGTEKALRARIARKQVPFRRLGGRIYFLRSELFAFLATLPGCTAEEAVRNADVSRESGPETAR